MRVDPREEPGTLAAVSFASFVMAGCLAGCAGNNKVALLDALQEYSDGVRWQRTYEVASYLQGAQRAAFVVRSQSLTHVQVTDCRVHNVQFVGSDRAVALVSIDWYSMRTAQLNRTLMRQSWRHDPKGNWRVVDQRWVQGATFPPFAQVAMVSAPEASGP